jgi:hypothetical protein
MPSIDILRYLVVNIESMRGGGLKGYGRGRKMMLKDKMKEQKRNIPGPVLGKIWLLSRENIRQSC